MEVNLAIKKTIRYAYGFKSYLNKNEIGERLISKKIFSKEEIYKEIKKIKEVEKINKWYVKKFGKAKILAQKIEKNFSDILFFGISGSVASSHPKEDDDIDCFVITKDNKLWKTRLFLRWWVWKKRIPHRKYKNNRGKDEFCFNLWLDESSLLLSKDKQNLRNAVDLVLLKPLINRNKNYEKFILVNDWVKKWVATPYSRLSANQLVSFSDKTKNNFWDKIINRLYFWPQYWYMKRKICDEKIGLHQAFFHKRMVK
jgi:hypothetical protein